MVHIIQPPLSYSELLFYPLFYKSLYSILSCFISLSLRPLTILVGWHAVGSWKPKASFLWGATTCHMYDLWNWPLVCETWFCWHLIRHLSVPSRTALVPSNYMMVILNNTVNPKSSAIPRLQFFFAKLQIS